MVALINRAEVAHFSGPGSTDSINCSNIHSLSPTTLCAPAGMVKLKFSLVNCPPSKNGGIMCASGQRGKKEERLGSVQIDIAASVLPAREE